MNRTVIPILILVVASPFLSNPIARMLLPNQHNPLEMQYKNSFSTTDPLQIFLHVRNNFIFEPYYGYMKGVNGTLNAGGGNDFDQAALLVHMLRRAKIQARYVEGTITLNIGDLENWLGVETRNASLRLLNQAGIPYKTQDAGGVATVQLAHVWVEAYLNGAWVSIDPSFKQYINHKSILEFPRSLQLAPLPNGTRVGQYAVTKIDTEQILRSIEYLQGKSVQAVRALGETNPAASRTIVPVQGYSMPPSAQAENVYNEIPTSRKYYVELTIPTFDPSRREFTFSRNVTARYPTAALTESRVTLYYLPVDSKTLKYIQSFPDLLQDPKLDLDKVQMYPVLRFNNTYRVMGEAMPLGYRMPLRARTLLAGELVGPAFTGRTFNPQVGTWNAVVINTGDSHLNDAILEHRIKQLNQIILATSQRPTDSDDVLGTMIDLHGRLYFSLLNRLSLLLQDAYGIRQVHEVDVAVTGFKYDWMGSESSGWHLRYAGPFIDWQTTGWFDPVSSSGDSGSELMYYLISRGMSSILEGQVMHLLYRVAPVSTVTILEAANEQGIPIFIIDRNNWEAASIQLSQPSGVINTIKDFVNSGSTIIIPQRQVTTTAITLTLSESRAPPEKIRTYVGTGWIRFSPSTCNTGWYISRQGSTQPQYSNPLEGGDSGVSWGPCSDCLGDDEVIEAFEGVLATAEIIFDQYGIPVDFSMGPYGIAGMPAGSLPLNLNNIVNMMSTIDWTDPAMTNAALQAIQAALQAIQQQQPDARDLTNMILRPLATPRISERTSGNMCGLEAHAQEAPAPDAYHSTLVTILHAAFFMQYNVERLLSSLEQGQPKVSSGTPSFGMVLVDADGRRTGFDPLTGRAYRGVNHLYEYRVTARDQTIGLWNLPTGNYTILLSNMANQPLDMALTSYGWRGTAYFWRSWNMRIPSKGSLAFPLSVSYDPQSGLRANLGNHMPAASIQLDNAEGGGVRGRLLDGYRNGLAGEEVRFYYRPPLSFTGWTFIGSEKTSASGSFILNWKAAPPGESTVMATYKDTFRAFTTVSVPFTVTVKVGDIEGKPLPEGPVTIRASNRAFTSMIQGGSVTFQAYPGYNMIEVNPSARSVLFIPVPTSVTARFDLRTTRTTSSTSLATQVTPTGLPNSTILMLVAVAAIATLAAITIKKQTSKRDRQT